MTDERDPTGAGASSEESVAAYKTVLRDALDRRPSGMRRRLAEALGRNPSFISQIANPTYPTPIPPAHIEPIFEVCHFSPAERETFLAAYEAAHPGRARQGVDGRRFRTLTVRVPDFDEPEKNREIDRLVADLITRLTRLTET